MQLQAAHLPPPLPIFHPMRLSAVTRPFALAADACTGEDAAEPQPRPAGPVAAGSALAVGPAAAAAGRWLSLAGRAARRPAAAGAAGAGAGGAAGRCEWWCRWWRDLGASAGLQGACCYSVSYRERTIGFYKASRPWRECMVFGSRASLARSGAVQSGQPALHRVLVNLWPCLQPDQVLIITHPLPPGLPGPRLKVYLILLLPLCAPAPCFGAGTLLQSVSISLTSFFPLDLLPAPPRCTLQAGRWASCHKV